ncbi:hypothetical protein DS901_16630 [Loktanella sp. D2R18]|uniref:hypothetical protein n=1 Tax=Rhodobacterales TaxID=204455 RepID=UPI000DE87B35|nr:MULTISPECIES: hypothetical protein [Rhodobacterales]MDO6591764.1 hypothetical protein [Yoonia sp. 1_MG-2023]RBW42319.1 hypothetical protein DS901_16630 [Loktanella sp. D2R18]
MKSDEDVGHPDQHAIDDWFLYGPKNVDIENLVRELTLERGLRLAQVEDEIVAALRKLIATT